MRVTITMTMFLLALIILIHCMLVQYNLTGWILPNSFPKFLLSMTLVVLTANTFSAVILAIVETKPSKR